MNRLLLFGMVMIFLTACATADTAPVDDAGGRPVAAATESAPQTACPVTEPALLTPPDDPAVMNEPAPGYYFANEDRSIWASAWWEDRTGEGWRAGKDGNKVGWFKPSGAGMAISGRRLDAPAEPMRAEIPAGYPTRFQSSGLYFPTEGCWEVTARAEGSELVFVVEVGPEP